jgi:hypothetical protein
MKLPDSVRQIAILVTGAHFRAAYEIYAHVPMAERDKISGEKLAAIAADQRPADLTQHEAIAYDVSAALTAGGVCQSQPSRQRSRRLACTARRNCAISSASIVSSQLL